MLEKVLDVSDDKLVAEHAKCAIPMLVKEIDNLRSVLNINASKNTTSNIEKMDEERRPSFPAVV